MGLGVVICKTIYNNNKKKKGEMASKVVVVVCVSKGWMEVVRSLRGCNFKRTFSNKQNYKKPYHVYAFMLVTFALG